MKSSDRTPADQIPFLDQEAQDFVAAMGRSLAGPGDLKDAIVRVLTETTEFLNAEEASIFLVDSPSSELVLTYASGEVGRQIIGLRLQSGQGVVGWVVKNSEDLIVPYPGLDERFFGGVDKRTGFTTRSLLCGPIRTHDATLGAVEVMNKRVGTFNDDDLVVLRAVAGLLAGVIPNRES
jgi:GAF domain-containing protein